MQLHDSSVKAFTCYVPDKRHTVYREEMVLSWALANINNNNNNNDNNNNNNYYPDLSLASRSIIIIDLLANFYKLIRLFCSTLLNKC